MENDKEHFMPGSNSVAGTSGGYVYLAGDSCSGTLKGSETWPRIFCRLQVSNQYAR